MFVSTLSQTLTLNSTVAAIPPLSTATDVSTVAGPFDSTTLALIGSGSVPALAAVLSLADPEKRRQLQAEKVGGGDKEVVKEYFNKSGFQRWKKIYGDTDEVNRVQLDIRIGHSKTVENVMKMLTEEGPLQGVTVCDAGCGTGCLSIPLAKEEVIVTASYISAAMVEKQGQFLIWFNTFGAFGVGSAFISLASTIQSIQGFGELGVVYLWAEKWLSRSE